jgi:hypothetical protein
MRAPGSLIVHKGFSNFALKLLLDLLKLGLYPVNYLAPPIKRCLKFMAPAVKKIEFLLIGHVFPVYIIYIVVPVLSTSSPLLSHDEISPFCEILAEILACPALEEMLQSARSIEIFGVRWLAPTNPPTPSEIFFLLPDKPRLDLFVRCAAKRRGDQTVATTTLAVA